MLKAILRSTATNARRFLYIWLAVLVANQLFVFGACFAPHCLAAAVPHTLAIAILVNFFGFKREETGKKQPPLNSSLAPPMKAAPVVNHAEPAVNSAEWKRPAARKSRVGPVILYVLIALCIGLGLLTKNGSRTSDSPTDGHTAEVEPISDATENGKVLDEGSPAQAFLSAEEPYQEVPDERAPVAEREAYEGADREIPDERLSMAERRRSQATGATVPRALTRYEDGDDEFDVNDIEQYERLTKTKYRDTDRTKHQAVATKRAISTDDSAGAGASAHQAYRCVNSSGRVGAGTGRPTREGEYSAFLRKSVHADEFVIFQYQGSTKEYWFKSSKCQRL